MAPSRPLVYWDACCFLSYLSGDPSRSVLRTLMEDARAGGILLVTSAISIAEVAYLAPEGLSRPLDRTIEEKIERMWGWVQAIRIVETHAGIGRRARDLLRHALAHSWERNARDAIHLASAQLAGATTVHTYYQKWDHFSQLIERSVERPNSLYVTQAGPGRGAS